MIIVFYSDLLNTCFCCVGVGLHKMHWWLFYQSMVV